MALDVIGEMVASVREQNVVHEGDRSGGPFDIEQDGFDARRRSRAAHRAEDATYVGPKHTGWNPWSIPVSV